MTTPANVVCEGGLAEVVVGDVVSSTGVMLVLRHGSKPVATVDLSDEPAIDQVGLGRVVPVEFALEEIAVFEARGHHVETSQPLEPNSLEHAVSVDAWACRQRPLRGSAVLIKNAAAFLSESAVVEFRPSDR